MGSMIHLAIGRLEIDWGKNHGFSDHSALYQIDDVKDVAYYYVADDKEQHNSDEEESWEIETVYKEGLSKSLHHVVDRIQLLGHTLRYSKEEFYYLSQINNLDVAEFSFDQLSEALAKVDVKTLSPDYGEGGEDFGKFFRREIFPRLNLGDYTDNPHYVEYEVGGAMENISPYTIIQLLAGNTSTTGLSVDWSFNDLSENGWAKRSDFIRPLDQSNRFLIVTEGSSDAKIIKHAFAILKPHISDFFDYVDMEEGYPFTGTGNLINFVKGLISISVQNNLIVLFDNDAEGVNSFNKCNRLNVLENMRILKLPDHEDFQNFPTIGPSGQHFANINGQGVGIECYLDLDDQALVRWNNYIAPMDAYQAELINKDQYKKDFLGQKSVSPDYNYTKIEGLLNMIIQTCIQMQEEKLLRDLDFER